MHWCIMHQIPWSMLRFVWEVQKVISEEEKNIHSIAEKTIPARNVRIKLIWMNIVLKTVNIAENNLINTKAPLVKISIWITEKIIYCKECEDEVNQKDILPNNNTKNNKNLFRLLKLYLKGMQG